MEEASKDSKKTHTGVVYSSVQLKADSDWINSALKMASPEYE